MITKTLPWFLETPNPEIYLNGSFVTVDFETTNREHGSPYCRENSLVYAGWQLSENHPHRGEGGLVRGCWGTEFEQSQLLRDIAAAQFVVAHFSKFEAGWLRRCGLELRDTLFYCTQIGEYVLGGNVKPRDGLGLDATCRRYGIPGKQTFVSKLIASGVCPSRIPASYLAAYCARDVEATHRLFHLQRECLARKSLLPVTLARNLVTPVLVDIESRGMCLDAGRVARTHAEYSAKYSELSKKFADLTGGINPKSGKQMREYVYGKLAFEEVTDHRGQPLRTEAGQAKTDKAVLAKLKAETAEQKEFKKLAVELAKLKVPVQNLEKMKAACEAGGIVYANLNQTVTDTHRLSSSGRGGGFQFHNFDRAFKSLFKARLGGYQVVEADAPQLEFRVAAFAGLDEVAKRDIETGADIHSFTASILGTSRQNAKAHTFKPLYGGQSGTPKEQAYYQAFREKYKGIYETQKGWTLEVLRTKQLRIPSGLVFYWPDTETTRSGFIKNTPSIYNYPIQSFATADIIPLTLVLIWHGMRDMEGFLTNTIHDSVIAEIPENELDEFTKLVIFCFSTRVKSLLKSLYSVDFDVPLGVAIKQAPWWGEGKEESY